MATIMRHPVPPESYAPDRPLNDLGRDQLKHFIHIAERLPKSQRQGLVVPSPEDGMASSRFIAEVTTRVLNARKKAAKPIAVRKRSSPEAGLALAAAAKKSKAKPATKPAAKRAVKQKRSPSK